MAYTIPWNLLGLQVSGDLGGMTIYTDRYQRKIAFPKSPPTKPPSPAQVIQRERFRQAQEDWTVLSSEEKAVLEHCCRKLSLSFTGQNLWIHLLLTDNQTLRFTLEQQSGLALPPL